MSMRRIEKPIRDVYTKLAERAKRSSRIDSIATIGTELYSVLQNKLPHVYYDGASAGVEDVESVLGKPILKPVEKAVSIEDLLNLGLPSALKVMRTIGIVHIKTISSYFFNQLKNEFAISAKLSESQAQLMERIAEFQEDKVPWMARRIAQTETTQMFNGGSQKGYELSTVVGGKQWIANLQGNPRPAHEDAHLQVVPVKKPFIVDNETLMFPGDTTMGASPGNTINCHCCTLPVIKI